MLSIEDEVNDGVDVDCFFDGARWASSTISSCREAGRFLRRRLSVIAHIMEALCRVSDGGQARMRLMTAPQDNYNGRYYRRALGFASSDTRNEMIPRRRMPQASNFGGRIAEATRRHDGIGR